MTAALLAVCGLVVAVAVAVRVSRLRRPAPPDRPAYARFGDLSSDGRLRRCPGACPGLTWQRLDGDGYALCSCGQVQAHPANTAP